MRQFIVSHVLLTALVAGSLTLAGCGQGAGLSRAGFHAGDVRASQVTLKAKPTLEEAYAAAQARANQLGGGQAGLVNASASGVGVDGRLMLPAELRSLRPQSDDLHACWTFTFAQPDHLLRRDKGVFWEVEVNADGSLNGKRLTLGVQPVAYTYQPSRCVPLARALRTAIADGLPGQDLHVRLVPADSLFFGLHGKPHAGPLTFHIGVEHNFRTSRQVTAQRGELRRQVGPAELAQIRQLIQPVIDRWFGELTGGGTRPINQADLARRGLTPARINALLQTYDANNDAQITRDEFSRVFTSPQWLEAWRQVTVEMAHFRADANQDERLTMAESAALSFEFEPDNGKTVRFALKVAPAEFAQADQDGDGALSLDEYIPLGLSKTLGVMSVEPGASDALFFIQTKPWSH